MSNLDINEIDIFFNIEIIFMYRTQDGIKKRFLFQHSQKLLKEFTAVALFYDPWVEW